MTKTYDPENGHDTDLDEVFERDAAAGAMGNPSLNNCVERSAPLTEIQFATGAILQRMGFGTGAVIIGQGVTILGQVLVVPIFLWAWGAELYGEWLSLYASVGYLSMLNLGMQMYVVNRLNQAYTIGKIGEYNQVLQSALKLFLVITVIGGLLVAALLFHVPLERWLNFVHTVHATAALVGVLLSLQILGGIPLGLVTGTYRTFGEFPRGQMVWNFERFSIFALTAVILVLKVGLPEVAAIQLLSLIGVVVYVLKDLRRRHPEIKVGIAETDWRLSLSFLGPSFFFFLIQLSAGLALQGSTLLVGAVVGPMSVAVFVTLRTLANLVRQIVGSLNNVIWPEVTSLEALGDYARLRNAHSLLVKTTFAMCGSAAVFLHFEAKDIVQLWTGGRIVFDQTLMDLFLVYLVLQTPWLASSLFPAAVNRHKKLAITYLVAGTLGLALGYLFSSSIIGIGLGTKGVALGLLIGEVITVGWYVPNMTCRMLGEKIKRYWLSFILRGVPVLAAEGLGAWWISEWISSPLERAFMVFGIIVVMGVTGSYLFWADNSERIKIRHGFNKALFFFFRNP